MADVHNRGGASASASWASWAGAILALGGIVYSAGWQGSEIGHLRATVADQRREISEVRQETRAAADSIRTEMRAGDRTLIELGTRLTKVETTLSNLDETLRDFLNEARPARTNRRRENRG